jgi:hypothetical protein
MDLDNQTTIKDVVDQHGKEDMVVMLGMNADGVQIAAETESLGDPTWAGPLAGVSAGLPTYHILEEQVRTLIAALLYSEKLQMMELVSDVP